MAFRRRKQPISKVCLAGVCNQRVYYEQYPGVSYGLSVSREPQGPWYQISGYTSHKDWDKYSLPPKVRHGSMRPIERSRYDNLVRAFGLL